MLDKLKTRKVELEQELIDVERLINAEETKQLNKIVSDFAGKYVHFSVCDVDYLIKVKRVEMLDDNGATIFKFVGPVFDNDSYAMKDEVFIYEPELDEIMAISEEEYNRQIVEMIKDYEI
jgi:hypothetical protein